jgi:hypothetical protein
MKKSKLIKALNKLPGDPEVFLRSPNYDDVDIYDPIAYVVSQLIKKVDKEVSNTGAAYYTTGYKPKTDTIGIVLTP